MPNVLVLSFDGFSFSSRQLYEQLFPTLLSRAAVHESLTPADALSWIATGWPTIILIADAQILELKEHQLNQALIDYTQNGCTVVCMGLFAGAAQPADVLVFFHAFGLRWRPTKVTLQKEITLVANDASMIRTASLIPSFEGEVLLLNRVPREHLVYQTLDPTGNSLAYAAFGRVGLGRLGYVGDTGFGFEAERLILAMCHLDREEDSLQKDQ